jgi:hypothetical protein
MQRAAEALMRALESGEECDPDHGRFESWRRSLLMRALPEEHRP